MLNCKKKKKEMLLLRLSWTATVMVQCVLCVSDGIDGSGHQSCCLLLLPRFDQGPTTRTIASGPIFDPFPPQTCDHFSGGKVQFQSVPNSIVDCLAWDCREVFWPQVRVGCGRRTEQADPAGLLAAHTNQLYPKAPLVIMKYWIRIQNTNTEIQIQKIKYKYKENKCPAGLFPAHTN